MITQIYPYNRDFGASMQANANIHKYTQIKHLCVYAPAADIYKYIVVICVHLRSFAFSFSLQLQCRSN